MTRNKKEDSEFPRPPWQGVLEGSGEWPNNERMKKQPEWAVKAQKGRIRFWADPSGKQQ